MKRYISAVLIPCLLCQFTGCYSYTEISNVEFQSKAPDSDIKVHINDTTFYEIQKGYYYFKNDTLFTIGYFNQGDGDAAIVKDKIPFSDIEKIESESLNGITTLLTILGISALVYFTIVVIMYLGVQNELLN